MVRRILRYVKSSITLGLHLTGNPTLYLFAFSDADWAGCPTTRRSTTGFCMFLGHNNYFLVCQETTNHLTFK